MERTDLIRLGLASVSGVGPRKARALRDDFGGWEAAVAAAGRGDERVPAKLRAALAETPARGARVGEDCRRHGVEILFRGGEPWSEDLERLPDVPEVLFALGRTELLGERAVAIVGSRECSAEGADMACRLAERLVEEGWAVVSGLARGIDAAAHRGALTAPGDTIAVLGCGLDLTYPEENRALQKRIAAEGLLLSEFAPGMPPRPGNFPRRNRILAALAQAVVVVESRLRSGALVTVRHALDLGNEVYVVPGWPASPLAAGPLALLRDGARAVRGPDDLIEDLGGISERERLAPEESQLLAALGDGAESLEEAAAAAGLAPGEARERLARLELLGRLDGGAAWLARA